MDDIQVDGRIWLERQGHGLMGPGRAELLECIDAEGSIAAAARSMGMGYKRAWDMVEAMNNRAEAPLVERATGGRGGGGTRLTEAGRALVADLRAAEAAYARFLEWLSAEGLDSGRIQDLMERFALRSSARNQWWGRVATVVPGPVNDEVTLRLGGGESLVAVVTHDSAEALELAEGAEVAALVKATHVVLAADEGLRTSARNQLCGTVECVEEGPVESEVALRLPGGNTVTAVVTNASARGLGLAAGEPACALIKASHVILAVSG